MEQRLLLKDTNGELIAELLSFTYNAKRMGGAPTISATLHSFDELTLTTDDYVEFNGEKYYIKHTPTSSKSNTDARYKYDLEFVSERIMLDEVYFHNASWSTVSGVSKAISKGSNFSFIGSIRTLADRINASLAFSKIEKYKVVVSDEFTEVEDKFIQFSDVFVSNAIQEFYNTFKIPYYFYWDENEGKTIIIVTNGSAKSPTVPFEYGKDNALLSITKTNANYKIINKCTGVGSSENLPYYYPNVSATGEHTFKADEDFGDTKINYNILDKHTNLRDGATLTYHKKPDDVVYKYLVVYSKWEQTSGVSSSNKLVEIDGTTSVKGTSSATLQNDGYMQVKRVTLEFNCQANEEVKFVFQQGVQTTSDTDGIVDNESIKLLYEIKDGRALSYVGSTLVYLTELSDGTFSFSTSKAGVYSASVYICFKLKGGSQESSIPINLSATFTPYRKVYKEDYFTFDDNSKEIGVSLSGVIVATPKDGGQIVVSETKNWIEPQQALMPSIYRGTNGVERYYIASNESVTSEGYTYDFNGHQFTNPYAEGRPKEHIITVDDLKPTIKGMWVNDERIDMFSAFAYDVNDNDEIDEENHYKHPFFYAKLKKLDFNLFDQSSEKGEMTISFTSGQCASCNFTLVVDENTKKNLVQVDDNGDLVFDENGVVKQISSYQSKQQDTINNEVWIALRKEDSTMGVVMPNVSNNAKPTSEDTFVITNINLPLSYILNAEKQLENKIKEYLVNNNDDKFNFSIKFSRIYLAENKDVRDNISENSSLSVIYQGKESTLYVSSYTYKMDGGEALPEISVELSDTLSTSNGVMRNVINQVKMEVMTSVANVDVVAQGARAFIRKDQNDQTVYRLTANELNVNTDSNVGGSLDVGSNATVGGEMSVERKASFRDNLEVGADITVGDYQEVLGEIQGAKISQQGDAVFKSVRANYLEIFTLIYNKIRATSAYTVFDDTATIIDISEDEDGVYTLTFEGDAEYIQPFTEYDIVHGFVNSLNNYGYSIAGECWMNIVEVQPNDNNNQVRAILFSDEDTPSKNIAPTKNMVIGHKGNNAPKGLDDAKYDKRRNTFFISSADGNIVQLMDVTSPKLLDIKDGYSNYGVVMGKLPSDLFEYIKSSYSFVSENDPILYAKYVAVQNLLQIDYLGRLIKTERYRGEWNKDVAEGKEEGEEVYRSLNSTDVTYYDTVSYEGSKWQCFTDKTTEAPSKNSTAWTIIVEKGEDGKSATITANDVFYATSTNGASHPDLENGGWSKDFPKVDDGTYLWTWTHVEYSDGNKSNVFSVSRKGIDGKGIQSSVVTYAIKATPSAPEKFDEDDWGDFPTVLTDGYWLYTRTIVTYSDENTSVSYDVTQVGQGSYYAGLQEYYAAGSSDTTIPTGYPTNKDYVNGVATYVSGENVSITENWSVSRPTLDSSSPYLWNFSISRDSKGNQYVVFPVCIGNFAKGIKSVVEMYAISAFGVVPEEGRYPTDITSWDDEANAIPPTKDKPYQWNYTKTTYNDGTFDEVYHVVSVKGDKGDKGDQGETGPQGPQGGQGPQGPQGPQGNTGNGIADTVPKYGISASFSTKPTIWKDSIEELTINEGDILWTWIQTIYTNGDASDSYTSSRQAVDNSAVEFSLQPNVTTIYIHDEDNLSTESINLTVRKATSKGVEIIDNNADLEADGFKLQYTYDGILDDRKDIVLNPETILLEDGSEMLLEDDSAAELEFTVEDILNVKNYIEFYLVKTYTNEIWATCTVAVVHDGESTLSVELSIKDITVNVNVETEPWQVLDPTTEYQVNVQVKKGGVAQDLSKYTLSNRSNTNVSNSEDTFSFITIDAYTKAVILPIANGMPFSYLPKWVEFTAVNKSHTNRKASDKLYIKSSQRGWTGPMGNDGASYYPQGEWDANTEYVATKNSDGVVIARPIVYHDPLKNGNGTYYVLEADKSIDDDPAEFSPSVWRAFQSFEYLFTKVLMAQWAQLSDAVFRGSYMFSSYGVDANGNRNIYSNFQDNENNMFESVVINGKSTYRLNGKFTPNIFLDLLNGGAKFNCLSEPFVQMKPSTSLYKIDPSIAHNVSVQYGRGNNPAMIFMPESDSLTDGVNCTVVYQSISMTGDVHEMNGVEWGENLGNKLVILCADGRMRNTSYETDRNEGFFMVNGIPTRMLFIAPGDVVKLKSVEIANKKRVWVVENQSDFSIMESNFYFKKNKKDIDDLFNVVCNNVGWYPQGMDSSFASARIMAEAPDNTTPLNYNVYLEDGSLEAYND